MPDRDGLQPSLARGLDNSPLGQAFRFVSRPIALRFAVANVPIEIHHATPDIPDGYIVLSSSGTITRPGGVTWSKDLAYLQTTTAPDEVVVLFVVLKEEPFDVTP